MSASSLPSVVLMKGEKSNEQTVYYKGVVIAGEIKVCGKVDF